MNLERQNARPTSIQDELVASTVPYTYDESEEDSQDTTNAPKWRRGPVWAIKLHMDYRGMISKESKNSAECAFLGSVDPYAIHAFSFSSASSLFTKDTYFSEDETFENIHPSSFYLTYKRMIKTTLPTKTYLKGLWRKGRHGIKLWLRSLNI